MKQLGSIKNKFANRTFFDSSIEISGLFRSPSPSELFSPPPPNWSCSCCYQCIHFRLLSSKSTFISPKIWLAIKFIKIQEKITNRIGHIEIAYTKEMAFIQWKNRLLKTFPETRSQRLEKLLEHYVSLMSKMLNWISRRGDWLSEVRGGGVCISE